MKKIVMILAALGMMTGVAFATDETTTTTTTTETAAPAAAVTPKAEKAVGHKKAKAPARPVAKKAAAAKAAAHDHDGHGHDAHGEGEAQK